MYIAIMYMTILDVYNYICIPTLDVYNYIDLQGRRILSQPPRVCRKPRRLPWRPEATPSAETANLDTTS